MTADGPGPDETADKLAADNVTADEATAGAAAADEPEDPFEALVFAALDSLPDVFRERLGSVAVVIEDEATPEELEQVGARGLFGLYTGVPRTAYGADQAMMPSKITIYREPHLRAFRSPEALARGVTSTVFHEVAHHFGISDARLEEMARENGRGRF